MRRVLSGVVVLVMVLGWSSRAEAVPMLQLDIVGGSYDEATESIISDGPNFTLVALLTLRPQDVFNPLDTYFVSAALSEQIGPGHSAAGSYTFNGIPYNATTGMIYGTPPLEGAFGDATRDPGDLAYHGTFPTFFNEFAFQFSAAQKTATYNSELNPGGLAPASSGETYFQTFNVTTSLVGVQLHFDLYDTYLQSCGRNRSCTPDEDIDHFAPFSHDAQSGPPTSVPEPTSMMFVALGLALAGRKLISNRPE